LINEYEYNLVSTAVHVGAQNDGHYVSFTKRRDKWFCINDEMVREEELPDQAGFYFMVYNLKN
jgi:ubiquitin C-terminal hydrolase